MPHPTKRTRRHPIQLTEEQVKTLQEFAESLGFTYAGRGSVSLLIQVWADFLRGGVDGNL